MKIFLLTALFASVVYGNNEVNWPWQVGKLYRYEVLSHTLAKLPEGASAGYAFRSTFVIRAKANGQLQARLENPERIPVHKELADLSGHNWDKDSKPETVKDLSVTFDIKLEGGRVVALNVPSTLSLPHENLLKGLISTLQVDLSTYGTAHSSQNNYDQESQQGQFTKMETDVTGECATLYNVAPPNIEWRRELRDMNLTEDPVMITKSRNYGHCHQRVDYHFGVPESAEWTGTAKKPEKEQFIERAANSRILVGKNGPIYKARTINKIFVHPYMYGDQKAEVHSYTKLMLVGFEEDRSEEWEAPKNTRAVHSLLYSMSSKQVPARDRSDESYEQEDVDITDAVKTRTMQKMVSINKKIVIDKRYNYVDAEDSSSSDLTSAFVNDDALDTQEPAYAALYMTPQSHKANKQNPINAQKLVQELTQLLQKAANMPKFDFLSKFNILVRVIASMDYEQLSQTSRGIEVAKASNNVMKADMWMIYRDAVVQAGTLPSFKQIMSWIQTKKIQGEEAAQVVTSLANTLRYPTKSVMVEFFEMAMSPDVVKQQFLNSTALIAASKLINMAQVNNMTAHSRYPTHMYGRLARKHDNFVYEEILPRLRQALEIAIQQEDTRNAQVYIKAIGKLGHRSILQVYAPYLEGKIPVSTYLRALMVDSLVILAYERDRDTLAVLYGILCNPAQPSEVRLAAIQNIFVAEPTTAMMQAMAQMTNEDLSIQVRAAIKTSIEAAAELKNLRYLQLARTAQAAKPMLTKEQFGNQYFNRVYFDNDFDLGIMGELSMIGSEDSVTLPKFLRHSWWSRTYGWSSVSASVSSVQRLVEMFKWQMSEMKPEKYSSETEANHKYTAGKVSEMLKIKREPQDPLAAALYMDFWSHQRYFTFSEQDLNQMPGSMKQMLAELMGSGMHYTKVFNKAQTSIMFPLSSGMPFIYKYKEPTVIHIQAKVQKFENAEQSVNFKSEIQFTFARNIDGSVGFLDTLSNQIAKVGVVNKIQLHIPLQVDYTLKKGEHKLRLQKLNPEQDILLAHYSVWPYTTLQKKDSLVPVSLEPTAKLITRGDKLIKLTPLQVDQYQIEGYSYSEDYKELYHMLTRKGQFLESFTETAKIVNLEDIALTHFNLRYKGEKDSNLSNDVTFTAVYDSFHNMNEKTQEPLSAKKFEDRSPNSAVRRTEIARRVASGINKAKAQVIDFSVDYRSKVHFVLTAAMANSPVDPKIQYALFAQGNENYYINTAATVTMPEAISLNAHQALEKELKMKFDMDIKFNLDDMISTETSMQIQGFTERTKQNSHNLKTLKWAKECDEQMKRNNYYQDECHKMIIMAQAPNHMNFILKINNRPDDELSRVVKRYLRLSNPQKMEINIGLDYVDKKIAIFVDHDEILNLHMDPVLTSHALATYYPIKPYERVQNYFTAHQFQPFCTIDGDQIRTFSERKYNYVLSPAWHVVMQDAPKEHPWQDELVVLAKKPTEQQQEVYISYQSEIGQDLEIQIKPASDKYNVEVKTNAKKASEGDLTMYWDKSEKKPLLQYYNLPDGVLMLKIRENRLRAVYDGQRLVVLARDGRNNIRGLCGMMNGDPRDDYWTPEGFVDSDEQFGASYALEENSEDRERRMRDQSKPQMIPYQRNYQYTNILKSDSEWQEWQKVKYSESANDWNSQKVFRTRSHLKQPRGTCVLTKQVQYYETATDICVTTRPLPGCSSHCKGEDYKVKQEQVVCGRRTEEQFQEYVRQINQGKNPNVTGLTQTSHYRVPASCKA